ncbi:MAG TPA: hypothetical protein VFG99_08690, partial [Chloroflexia bacterium]|nr:hypothetical protein [Chloroflexia bacterium]
KPRRPPVRFCMGLFPSPAPPRSATVSVLRILRPTPPTPTPATTGYVPEAVYSSECVEGAFSLVEDSSRHYEGGKRGQDLG